MLETQIQTSITGISEWSALCIFSEVGPDMSCWKTEKHFTSRLGLAPNTKISGGKVLSSHVPRKKHCAGQAFRPAALSISNSKGPLGDFYRRIRSFAGAPKALVTVARKPAVIYYRMMTAKQAFHPEALVQSQEKYKQHKIKQLERKPEKLKNAA
ncbi:MAG: transposase [Tannerella sp.]|nr:transposase [Tannerella sp.]